MVSALVICVKNKFVVIISFDLKFHYLFFYAIGTVFPHSKLAAFQFVSFVPYSEMTDSNCFRIILQLNGLQQTGPRLCRQLGQYNTMRNERIVVMSIIRNIMRYLYMVLGVDFRYFSKSTISKAKQNQVQWLKMIFCKVEREVQVVHF